ncbi:MAG: dicarboxylate/amino acid:cation symporter [Candidatus Sumerlaeaceae bacterium]|nr:dicarboxylate/amino acid:cation symporter [Candidatus Sumerlaeaceae bacterium]
MSEKRRLSLPVRILLGLLAGVALAAIGRTLAAEGYALRWGGKLIPAEDILDWTTSNVAQPVGNIFLNLMFMVVIPLVFSSLALGVAGLGDLKTVGRLGGKILAGTILLSGASVIIGLVLVNTFKPGMGIEESARAKLMERTTGADVEKSLKLAEQSKPFAQVISDSFSRNPVEDAANLFTPNPNYRGGGIMAFLVFCIIVGAAITSVGVEKSAPVVKFLESLQELCMAVIGYAMAFAPFGVAALIFQTSAKIGLSLFVVLGKYIAVVLAGLLIQLLVTYSAALWLVARRSPLKFFAAIEEVIITAFSTSSSNATLPTSLRVSQTRVGLPKSTSSFVLTVGATGNQNGTALFEGITVLFLAQFFGVHLDIHAQCTVVLMSMLAGVGTAGVPGGSIPLIALLLQQVGVPAAGIGIILGVDRLLDMSRTVVNVVGDIVLATMVSPKDGIQNEPVADA